MGGWQEIDKYFVLYTGTAGMLLLCTGMLLFFRAYNKKLLAQQEQRNQMELAYKDELLYSNIQATEKERARIARDLHDEIGTALSLLRMQVNSPDAKTVIDNTIDNVRRISYDLLPPVLESFGLTAALLMFFEKMQQNTSISIQFDAVDEYLRFDAMIEIAAYRIIQELMHNTLKHAGADTIRVVIQFDNNNLNIGYCDNGKGYDYTCLQKKNGLGLRNIELRAKQCGGILQYQTQIDNSVVVNINIPTISKIS